MAVNAVRAALRKRWLETEVSLEKLAEHASMERSAVARIMNLDGKPIYNPRIKSILSLVEALDMSMTQFSKRVEGATLTLGPDELKKLVELGFPLPPADPKVLKQAPRIPAPPISPRRKSSPAKHQAARNKRGPGSPHES